MVKYGMAMRVKNLARTGWMMRGIPPSDAETVGSHTFEVAFLSMLLVDRLRELGVEINEARVLRMALLHDIAESVTGDIVRGAKNMIAGSKELEEKAMGELEMEGYLGVLRELNEGRSVEALVVKICDNLATMLQGVRYVNKGYSAAIDIVESTKRELEALLGTETLPEEVRRALADAITKLVVSEEL